MKIKLLNTVVASQLLENWDGISIEQLDNDYQQLRDQLVNLHDELIAKYEAMSQQPYIHDLYFGVYLKDFLDRQPWFNLRLAANIGFWRYLSVVVIPDVVNSRWPKDSADHYWKKPSRIWLRSIWWWAFLGWQGDVGSTIGLLCRPVFNTDSILNMCERTGRKGTLVEMYKQILKTYASLEEDKIIAYNRKTKKDSDTLFRGVMRQNSMEILLKEPTLCDRGVIGYVESLFKALGIEIVEDKDS